MADPGHQAFLNQQPPLHPILQQIHSTSAMSMSGTDGVPALANPLLMQALQNAGHNIGDNALPSDDVAMDIAQEGLQESTRWVIQI